MGHLFRCLNFIKLLEKKRESYVVILNEHSQSESILKKEKIVFETVDLNDITSDWETRLIKKYKPAIWINDRLETTLNHVKNIIKNNIHLISFDDIGEGGNFADINFGMMPCFYEKINGKNAKTGLDFFILNENVNKYQRKRKKIKNVIVTLGGSDTYGVTIKVADALKKLEIKTTIITGPSFQDKSDLLNIIDGKSVTIKSSVPSLIKEFYNYDLAITGGGITPFEANATGLPCLIIANESHEVDNGLFLKELGSSDFAGFHANISFASFTAENYNIEKMSEVGLENFHVHGAENIYNEIERL
jgi:spore coat polysaccharide biosynthesis predicted glycosyltransferase SpsG